MRIWINGILALGIVAIGILPTWAQRPDGRGFGGFRGDLIFLANQSSVQQELNLNKDQTQQASQLVEKQREQRGRDRRSGTEGSAPDREEMQKRMRERVAENQKALAQFLDENQMKRLKQISLQQQGAMAYGNEGVAAALQLTDAQKREIESTREETFQKMRSLFQDSGNNTEESQKQREALRKTSEQKLTDLLTAQQKEKWNEMIGKPFAGKIDQPDFGRRRGGRSANN